MYRLYGREGKNMRANIENGIIERLQERYPQAEIIVRDIQKTNVTLRAVSIKEQGATLAPTMYLEEIYESVKDIDKAVDIISRNYEKHKDYSVDTSFLMNFEDCKGKITGRLISVKKNRKALAKLVYSVQYEDLALVYYVKIAKDASVGVTLALLSQWGVSAEEVHTAALENLKKEVDIMDMGDFIGGGYGNTGMYIISNKEMYYGAAAILAVEKFLTEMFGRGGFYMIPSSVHEVICFKGDVDEKEADRMVREVNAQELSAEDFLSDHVYKLGLGA